MRAFDLLKRLLVRYGVLLGTAILLFSWIIEKNYAAHWDQKMANLAELRTHASLELLVAQSNAIFLTRKAETKQLTMLFETNKDILNAFYAHKRLVDIFDRKLPSSYKKDLKFVKEMLNQVISEYTKDYEVRGERNLLKPESETVSNLYDQIQALLSVGESALSTEVFYQAGKNRLNTLKKITQILEDHKNYDKIFTSLDHDMNSFADSLYTGKPSATSVAELIDRLYSITQNAIQDLHIYGTNVAKMKYRYSYLYKFSYVFGSLLILGSMILKNIEQGVPNKTYSADAKSSAAD